MKTVLDLRLVHHRREDRIRSHVLFCRLGLLLIRVAETRTGRRRPDLRRELDRVHLGTLTGPPGRSAAAPNSPAARPRSSPHSAYPSLIAELVTSHTKNRADPSGANEPGTVAQRRAEALRHAARRKRETATARDETAIRELVKTQQEITCRSVARTGGISLDVLYATTDLRRRIETLRAQPGLTTRTRATRPQRHRRQHRARPHVDGGYSL